MSDLDKRKRAYRLGTRMARRAVVRFLKDEHVAEEVGANYVRDFWRGVLDYRSIMPYV